jgi:DNA-binding IclR family transcriptional regulator
VAAEQDQLIQQARLRLSAPEVVFEELKKQAQWSRSEWFSYDDEEIEPSLLERNEPHINLGLACFGFR